MLRYYSSRQNSLLEEFLNPNLRNAREYNRLAGYFSSSILDVAGELIESVNGPIRVICNSGVETEDVRVAKLARIKVIREWKRSDAEEKAILYQERFKKLYSLLKDGKMEVRVIPADAYGLVHAKSGVITLEDGSKIAFIGTANETRPGWTQNYEMLWADDTNASVNWTQEEFDLLWNSPYAIKLDEVIIEDIGRIAQREVISLEEWRKNPLPAAVAVESPMYKDGLELWNHQKYFIKMVFDEYRRRGGARYILADEAGLGKTAQLAVIAELITLMSDKPALIIVPKTLLYQWQEDLKDMFGIPSAVFEHNRWITEDGEEDRTANSILDCPRRIAIVSHGLLKRMSSKVEPLLDLEYGCVIVDEAHKARRKNLNRPNEDPDPNNMMDFLMKLSKKTDAMVLATATPIQLDPIEGWDLLYILAQNSSTILGSDISHWRVYKEDGIRYISEGGPKTGDEAWPWIRDPLPYKEEGSLFEKLRRDLGLRDSEIKSAKSYNDISVYTRKTVDEIARRDFFQKYNPFIRFIVKRTRKYLEESIDPRTGKPFFEKINVEFPEEQNDGLATSIQLEEAYSLALHFTDLLTKRGAKGFYKTLLLRRIGSSVSAGLSTARAILSRRIIDRHAAIGITEEELEDMDDDEIAQIKLDYLDNSEELECLQNIIELLNDEQMWRTDPKYNKIKQLLMRENWMEKGCIIFSEYFDTVEWIAQKLSEDLPIGIGLYAGLGNSSGIYRNGILHPMERNEVKEMVSEGKLKILVGTDAAGEGLNLQMLGTLINVDLPWNPTRLEQRLGRIRRPGQINDTVYVYNLFYKNSIEEHVHEVLKRRIEDTSSIIGAPPQVLSTRPLIIDDPAVREIIEEIDEQGLKHPFDLKYENQHMEPVDWGDITKTLDNEQRLKCLIKPWQDAK